MSSSSPCAGSETEMDAHHRPLGLLERVSSHPEPAIPSRRQRYTACLGWPGSLLSSCVSWIKMPPLRPTLVQLARAMEKARPIADGHSHMELGLNEATQRFAASARARVCARYRPSRPRNRRGWPCRENRTGALPTACRSHPSPLAVPAWRRKRTVGRGLSLLVLR